MLFDIRRLKCILMQTGSPATGEAAKNMRFLNNGSGPEFFQLKNKLGSRRGKPGFLLNFLLLARDAIWIAAHSNGLLSVRSALLGACSMCQLKCPICPTANRLNEKGVIGRGYLRFDDFKNNPGIKTIELSSRGEYSLIRNCLRS